MLRAGQRVAGVTVYLFMLFYSATMGTYYVSTNEKEKRKPYVAGKETGTARLRNAPRNPLVGREVVEGSRVSWCRWSQNTGI